MVLPTEFTIKKTGHRADHKIKLDDMELDVFVEEINKYNG